VEGFCEHGNEHLGSMKCLEVLEYLHNLASQEGFSFVSLVYLVQDVTFLTCLQEALS
jgi:hypothetical protein